MSTGTPNKPNKTNINEVRVRQAPFVLSHSQRPNSLYVKPIEQSTIVLGECHWRWDLCFTRIVYLKPLPLPPLRRTVDHRRTPSLSTNHSSSATAVISLLSPSTMFSTPRPSARFSYCSTKVSSPKLARTDLPRGRKDSRPWGHLTTSTPWPPEAPLPATLGTPR